MIVKVNKSSFYLVDDTCNKMCERKHNDIKADNVLLTNSGPSNQIVNYSTTCGSKVVLIDFNKATEKTMGKEYKPSDNQKALYRAHHPHLAPKMINDRKQSTASDMFSVGKLFHIICQKYKVQSGSDQHVLDS